MRSRDNLPIGTKVSFPWPYIKPIRIIAITTSKKKKIEHSFAGEEFGYDVMDPLSKDKFFVPTRSLKVESK